MKTKKTAASAGIFEKAGFSNVSEATRNRILTSLGKGTQSQKATSTYRQTRGK